MHRRCCWPPRGLRPARQPVFDFVPKRRHGQGLFGALSQSGPVAQAVQPKTDRDIFGRWTSWGTGLISEIPFRCAFGPEQVPAAEP